MLDHKSGYAASRKLSNMTFTILTKSPFLDPNFLLVLRALSMREIGFCVYRFPSSRNLSPRSHWSSPFSRSTWRLRDLSAKLCRKNTVAHFPISSPLSQGFPLLAQKYFVYLPKNIFPSHKDFLFLLKSILSTSQKISSPLSQRFPLLFPPETIMIIMPETDQQHSQGRNPHV